MSETRRPRKDLRPKSKDDTVMTRNNCRMSLKIPKWYQFRGGEDLVIWLHAILDDLRHLDLSKGVKQAVHSDVKGGSWGRAYAKKTLKRWKQVKRSLSLDDAPINDTTNGSNDKEGKLEELFASHPKPDSKMTHASTTNPDINVHPIGIYKPIVKQSSEKEQSEVFRRGETSNCSEPDNNRVQQTDCLNDTNKTYVLTSVSESQKSETNEGQNNKVKKRSVNNHDAVLHNAGRPVYNVNNVGDNLQRHIQEEHTSSEDDERDEGYSSINRNDSDKMLDILNIDEFSEICERKLNDNCNFGADINPPDKVKHNHLSSPRCVENKDRTVASPTLCRTSKTMCNVTKANASKEMVEVVIKKKEAHVATLRAEMQYLVELADRHEDVEIEVVRKDKDSPDRIIKHKEKSPITEQRRPTDVCSTDRTKGEINILINASDVWNPREPDQAIFDHTGTIHQTTNHPQDAGCLQNTTSIQVQNNPDDRKPHQPASSSSIKTISSVERDVNRLSDRLSDTSGINEGAYLTQVEECINASDNDLDNDGTSNLKAGEQLETALLQIFAEKRSLQRQARIDNDFSYSMRSYTSEESVDSIQLLDDEQMTSCYNNDALSDDSDTLELIDPDTIDFGDYNKCEVTNDDESSYDDVYVTERAPLDPRTVLLDTIPEEPLPDTEP